MCAPADQRLYSGADLRCRRGALGLPEQDAAIVLAIPVAVLRTWEAAAGPVAGLTVVIPRLATLERLADRITEQLAGAAADTGRIVTFRTDAAASSAGVAQGIAALHRICAGRAWEKHPDARLVFHDLDEREEPASRRRAELMVRITMLGLTRADIKEWLGVERRRLTSWIRGDAAIPRGVFADLDGLEAAADAHTASLEEASAAAGGVVGVAADVGDLEAAYPAVDAVPLSTHWAAAGVLLADDEALRARWISPPSARRGGS
ncbi:MAG: hypothetical protein PHQ28_06885 [Mycobacterium sp.]|nr:hypothetical protein [Mycobacterium sp.]